MRNTLLAPCLLLAACNNIPGMRGEGGSGSNRSYSVSAFTGLTLAGPYDVVVTQGNTHAVRAEGDPNALDKLSVRTEDGELWIGSDRGGIAFGNSGKVVVHVTVPRLDSVTVGGSGDIRMDKMDGERFDGSIGGTGDLEIGGLVVREAEFRIAGTGDVKVAGRADRSEFKIAGTGDVDANSLQSRIAAVSIAGSGSVDARASESATISIVGSGDARIRGTTNCRINKLGTGKADCGV